MENIINVEALILSTNKKRCKKFIDYLNMKNSDEDNDESGNSLSIFSFQNNNTLEIKDNKNDKLYRVNFSKEFSEDKFYHCFIIIYDCCDKNSYDKATETFFPLIQNITSKLDFDFVLLMIGEYNENDPNKKEKVVQMEVSQNFAIANGFFLLEMNFSKKTNMDLINKVLKIRLSQSYMQFPEYYDKSRQTERHILNALKAFEFNYESERDQKEDNIVVIGNLFSENSRDREEFLTFEENVIDDKCDLESCLLNSPGGNLIQSRGEDRDKEQSMQFMQNEEKNIQINQQNKNSYKTNESLEKHSFFRDLFTAKTSNPTKIDSKKNANVNISLTNPNNTSTQTKSTATSSSRIGHRRTYSESNKTKFTSTPGTNSLFAEKLLSTTRVDSNTNKTKNTKHSDTSNKNSPIISLKLHYKEDDYNINITPNDTSEDIAKVINNHLGLKLDLSGVYSLAKAIAKKINKFIKLLSNNKNIENNHGNIISNYSYLVINMNKLLSKKRIKVAITVNNQKLNFYFDYDQSLTVNSNKLDDIVEETINSLDKEYEYDIKSLRQSLKGAVLSSVKNTLSKS